MDERYHVFLVGVSSSASSKQKVVERMAHLFGLSLEVVEQLFDRAPVAVKRSVDRATADEYQQMIQMAGGTCEVRPARLKSPSATAPATTAEPTPELAEPTPELAAPTTAELPAPAGPEPNKGAIILTIDERVLQRAAQLAAMPEEGSGSSDRWTSATSAASGGPTTAGKRCPKCGHVRLGTEMVPDYECPKCGIVYFKYEAYLERQKAAALPPEETSPPALIPPSGDSAAVRSARRQQKPSSKHPLRHYEATQLARSGTWLILAATALGALSRLLQHCGMEERFVSQGAWGYTAQQPTGSYYFGLLLSLAIALPLAIWGGVRIARSKWRHDAWGLLGVFSLIGLYVLSYRLADHRPPEREAEVKAAAPGATSGSS